MTQHFGDDPEAIPSAALFIRKGFIRAFTSGSHTGDVQLVGSHPTLLTDIRFATDIPAAECDVGRECLVIFLDPFNQTDAIVLSVQGAVPGAAGGGDDHAPTGALYPGVLTTGLKLPQVPYYGDGFTATKLYCRLSVPSQMTDVIVQFKRGVGESASSNLGSAVTVDRSKHIGSGNINQAVASGDYFEINVTQIGSSPNFGSDLLWLVAP